MPQKFHHDFDYWWLRLAIYQPYQPRFRSSCIPQTYAQIYLIKYKVDPANTLARSIIKGMPKVLTSLIPFTSQDFL
jgi:hypothetical protein